MALDMKETSQLVSILQMDDKPFESLLEILKPLLRNEVGGRICLALRCMILDDYYHTSGDDYNTELLITSFIVHSCSVGQTPAPPNTKSVLFQLLQFTESDIRERKQHPAVTEKVALKTFILQLIAGKSEVLQRTPREVLRDTLPELQESLQHLYNDKKLLNDLYTAKEAFEEEFDCVSHPCPVFGTTPILIPPDQNNMDTGPVDEWSFHTKEALDFRFLPVYDRPAPPPLRVGKELAWLFTEGHTTDLVWDTTMSNTHDDALDLRDRVQKALRQNLASEEQQALKQKLSQNPEALLRVGVSPARFPTLVERNSSVAGHFISTLVQSNLSTSEEFIVALVNMNPCLGACNVMSELVKLPQFPVHYAVDFIVNSISFIKSNARNMGDTRRIGIICAFCLSLARETDQSSPRARILQAKDLVGQLTQFAVEHANVSEASSLFKALKDNCGATGSG
ncbi:hypothetical protein DIPPA_00219 [Diplonema papillatum]|nr:hypothetical protein DIPPA_00219 [Diplonema papillatum]